MAFSTKLSDNFGKVFDQSPYVALDPIVKYNYVAKGRNIIFGRPTASSEARDLIYLGKVFETATGTSLLGSDAWLDTSFPHVLYITGTRGSGKSMDLGILIEGLCTLKKPSPIQIDVTPVTTFLVIRKVSFGPCAIRPRYQKGHPLMTNWPSGICGPKPSLTQRFSCRQKQSDLWATKLI